MLIAFTMLCNYYFHTFSFLNNPPTKALYPFNSGIPVAYAIFPSSTHCAQDGPSVPKMDPRVPEMDPEALSTVKPSQA